MSLCVRRSRRTRLPKWPVVPVRAIFVMIVEAKVEEVVVIQLYFSERRVKRFRLM